MKGPFCSLHNHTQIGSPLDGMNDVKELFVRAKDIGHPAIAITDHGTMSAHFDAYKASKEVGVKFIPGMEAYFVNDSSDKSSYHLVLLARNENGYKNLLELNYLAYQNQITVFKKKIPRLTWEHLERLNKDIFCLTACSSGIVGKTLISERNEKLGLEYINRFHSIFKDRLRLEIQPHSLLDISKKTGKEINQVKLNEALVKHSHDLKIPFVITCDAHYKDKEASKYHDLMLAVKDSKAFDDPLRFRYGVQDMYLKTADEIVDFFGSKVANIGMKNSIDIANACEEPDYLKPKGPILPKFDASSCDDYDEFEQWRSLKYKDVDSDKAYLRYKCIEGFKNKLQNFSKKDKLKYWERVKTELEVLEEKDFSSYMLIVADYINWAKTIMPVGSARGSSAGSLVAYLTGITDIDPIKYNLIFERFHNNQKTSFPDIDTDFSRPGLVKEYIKNKYGEDKVASISNWTTLSPKVIIKDVARSLRIGGDKSAAFKIANKITDSMGDEHTVEEEYKKNKVFAKHMRDNPELYLYAQKLQNLTRNWGVHAAGVVIGEEPLNRTVPLRIERKKDSDVSLVVTQWEKTRCEASGLIKMDILGLKTLTVIDSAFKLIKERTGRSLKTLDINLDDKETYDMIGRGSTAGVFQLESSLTPLCMKLKPRNIEDISAINAIGRPSCQPSERKNYINRRLGFEEAEYLHESTIRALKPTYGVLVYEEQAMFLAQDCAGWDLNQADTLRKITKMKGKDPELVLKTEASFVMDCVKNTGMSSGVANRIWETFIAPLQKYAFNKSHSISYSHISFHTAWLRKHYPIEFMTALLNSEDPNSKESQEYIAECGRMGIEVLPPSVNSKVEYTIISDKEILTGLSAIKGVGEKAAFDILNNGPYTSLVEFLGKTTGRVVNKTVMQSLAKSGAFDEFEITRKEIYDNYSKLRTKLNTYLNKNKKAWENDYVTSRIEAGIPALDDNEISDLSSNWLIDNMDALLLKAPSLYKRGSGEEWSKKEILMGEQGILGRTVSGSLHEVFANFFKGGSVTVTPFSKIDDLQPRSRIRVEAIVKSKLKEIKIKNGKNVGKKFAKYLIEDRNGNTTSMTVWADDYQKYKVALNDGIPFKAICSVNEYEGKKDLALSTLERIYRSGE